MHDDPKIFTGQSVCGEKAKSKYKKATPIEEGEMKRGILIRDLWMQRTDSVYEICVVNTDAVSCQSKNPEKCLETAES